jgi:hypothetical protein
MQHFNPTTPRLSYLLTFTAADVALGLGCAGSDPVLWRWTSRFCGDRPNGCTLGGSDAIALVDAVEQGLRRYRGARGGGIHRPIEASVEVMFWLFHDAIERCIDLAEEDCLCSWARRIGDAEELIEFLLQVARAWWSTGAERRWMFKALERLACLATNVFERDGSISRPADDDQSVKSRADRLAVRLFDAANDLVCDNWADEEWMSARPAA